MLTCPVSDLRALLRERPALIVHFSGCPRGIGRDINYPFDLRGVIADPQEIICCSTIEPHDFDALPFGGSGYVGVVLDPLDEKSVVYVDHEDHGAPPSTPQRLAMNRPESLANCARTFTRDGATPYNEWLVGPSRVIGVFVAPEAEVQRSDGAFDGVMPADVLSSLGKHRLFRCKEGLFYERHAADDWRPLDMSTVYP